jgi:hypothetical protein
MIQLSYFIITFFINYKFIVHISTLRYFWCELTVIKFLFFAMPVLFIVTKSSSIMLFMYKKIALIILFIFLCHILYSGAFSLFLNIICLSFKDMNYIGSKM